MDKDRKALLTAKSYKSAEEKGKYTGEVSNMAGVD